MALIFQDVVLLGSPINAQYGYQVFSSLADLELQWLPLKWALWLCLSFAVAVFYYVWTLQPQAQRNSIWTSGHPVLWFSGLSIPSASAALMTHLCSSAQWDSVLCLSAVSWCHSLGSVLKSEVRVSLGIFLLSRISVLHCVLSVPEHGSCIFFSLTVKEKGQIQIPNSESCWDLEISGFRFFFC